MQRIWVCTLVIAAARIVAANWMSLGMVGVSVQFPSNFLQSTPSDQPSMDVDINQNRHRPVTLSSPSNDGPYAPKPTALSTADGLCHGIPGLVQVQVRICQEHPNTVKAIGSGARRGITECQNQFRNERWNCTVEGEKDVFDHTLGRGSKETAFIYAITSAGVVHAVSQACSAGNLTDCSCDPLRQGQQSSKGWKWGGCSDNIEHGMNVAKDFVDAPEKIQRKKQKRDIRVRAVMNLHNNHAGRLAIRKNMEIKCRCHGVSGSCELQTCWRTLPPFRKVGEYLKEKYEKSIQLTLGDRRRLRGRGKVKRKVPVHRENLVHLHRSPNFCNEDKERGILGTTGRQCNKTADGPASCSQLCCGRGYNTHINKFSERCHCKFHWCCFVTCKICETTMEVHTCK